MAIASATYAATVVPDTVDSPSDLFIKYAWVLAISMIAWAAQSLPVLAEWVNGTARSRFEIIRDILKSTLAGFAAFWGSAGAGQNIMASYLAVALAAYAAERWLAWGSPTGPPDDPRIGERK